MICSTFTLQAIFQEELEHRALNVCQYSEANLRALMITVCEFIRDTSTNCKSVDSQFELIVEHPGPSADPGVIGALAEEGGDGGAM